MLQEVHEALESRDLVLVLMDVTRRVQFEAKIRPRIPEAGPRDHIWRTAVPALRLRRMRTSFFSR